VLKALKETRPNSAEDAGVRRFWETDVMQ